MKVILFTNIFRFINLELHMTEWNFLAMHKGVVDLVVSKKAFKELLGKLNVGCFAKKAVQQYFQVENLDPTVPQPSTSQDFDGTKPKVQCTERGKGRGKSRGRGRGRGQKSNTPAVVPSVTVQSVEKSDMMTQTDSDFEEYLIMSEQEFEEYQMYKEQKLMQQYLVSTIREEDFHEYDAE